MCPYRLNRVGADPHPPSLRAETQSFAVRAQTSHGVVAPGDATTRHEMTSYDGAGSAVLRPKILEAP